MKCYLTYCSLNINYCGLEMDSRIDSWQHSHMDVYIAVFIFQHIKDCKIEALLHNITYTENIERHKHMNTGFLEHMILISWRQNTV